MHDEVLLDASGIVQQWAQAPEIAGSSVRLRLAERTSLNITSTIPCTFAHMIKFKRSGIKLKYNRSTAVVYEGFPRQPSS